jgi:poly-gamma-glutamate synthesis protein (capsule biosynthesis protein)
MRRFVIVICILFLAFVSSYAIHITGASEYSIGIISKKIEQQRSFEPEKIRKQIPSTVRFVGDVLLARRVETLMDTYGLRYPFSRLPAIATSTLLVGNFEAAIPETHVHTPDLTYSFSVDEEHISSLKEYGFTALNLANNHTRDFGASGFEHTVASLDTNGLVLFGDPVKNSTTSVAFIETEQAVISLIGIHATKVLPTDEEIKSLFDFASTQSDIQIVYIHWGNEYQLTHSIAQERLAHRLVDAGADAVIGHHPHVVQDVELYNGAPIFYSLGNFVFDQYFSNDVQEGLMIDLQITSNKALVFKLLPVTSVDLHSVPRIMSTDESVLFLTDLAKRSQDELRLHILEGRIVVPTTP